MRLVFLSIFPCWQPFISRHCETALLQQAPYNLHVHYLWLWHTWLDREWMEKIVFNSSCFNLCVHEWNNKQTIQRILLKIRLWGAPIRFQPETLLVVQFSLWLVELMRLLMLLLVNINLGSWLTKFKFVLLLSQYSEIISHSFAFTQSPSQKPPTQVN